MTILFKVVFFLKLLNVFASPIKVSSDEPILREDCEDTNVLCNFLPLQGGDSFLCNNEDVRKECSKSCNVCAEFKSMDINSKSDSRSSHIMFSIKTYSIIFILYLGCRKSSDCDEGSFCNVQDEKCGKYFLADFLYEYQRY